MIGWVVSCQGLLRSECNPHSRTHYYTVIFTMFTLPAMLAFHVMSVRGFLWALRPALLSVMPKLKGRAFFDHAVHQRTNALSFDVRTLLRLAGPLLSVCSCERLGESSDSLTLAVWCRLQLG
jgi:hypothetical protein